MKGFPLTIVNMHAKSADLRQDTRLFDALNAKNFRNKSLSRAILAMRTILSLNILTRK
jgi:hypothetical protein